MLGDHKVPVTLRSKSWMEVLRCDTWLNKPLCRKETLKETVDTKKYRVSDPVKGRRRVKTSSLVGKGLAQGRVGFDYRLHAPTPRFSLGNEKT